MARLALYIMRRATSDNYAEMPAISASLMSFTKKLWNQARSPGAKNAKLRSLQRLLEELLRAPAAEECQWDEAPIIALLARASIKPSGKLMRASEVTHLIAKLKCACRATVAHAISGAFGASKATGQRRSELMMPLNEGQRAAFGRAQEVMREAYHIAKGEDCMQQTQWRSRKMRKKGAALYRRSKLVTIFALSQGAHRLLDATEAQLRGKALL